jgi:hypothetical protein
MIHQLQGLVGMDDYDPNVAQEALGINLRQEAIALPVRNI